MNIYMQNVIKNIKNTTNNVHEELYMISPHTHIQRTPVRRPYGKASKTLISGLACVRVGVGVRCVDGVKCGFRVQVGPRPRVRVRDGTGCG